MIISTSVQLGWRSRKRAIGINPVGAINFKPFVEQFWRIDQPLITDFAIKFTQIPVHRYSDWSRRRRLPVIDSFDMILPDGEIAITRQITLENAIIWLNYRPNAPDQC